MKKIFLSTSYLLCLLASPHLRGIENEYFSLTKRALSLTTSLIQTKDIGTVQAWFKPQKNKKIELPSVVQELMRENTRWTHVKKLGLESLLMSVIRMNKKNSQCPVAQAAIKKYISLYDTLITETPYELLEQ